MEFSFKNTLIYTLSLTHILTCMYAPTSWASIPKTLPQKILVQSIDAEDMDFENFINTNPEFISLEKIQPEVSSEAIAQIRSLQALANTEFMGEDPNKSIPLYEQIISMALDQDWNEEARKIIFTSFFRLAQLQPQSSGNYIKQAILFDLTQSPDTELISQNLLASFEKIKKDLDKEVIDFQSHSTKTYYVNGVKGQTQIHPQALYRLTFVSNVYGLKTEIVKGEATAELFPFGTPIAQGSCRNVSTVNTDIRDLKQSFVFSSPKCAPKLLAAVAQLTQRQMQQSEAHLSDTLPSKSVVAAQRVDMNLYPSSINTDDLVDSTTHLAPSSTKGKLSKKQKTWIIVVSSIAAVTLGAVLINKQNDKSRDYAPVESKGF
ncbi:MAG: hypothetical protein M9899_09200 [Bdellovibrionaceae bacterium]|nr:hypothetical protein [Pseudobdellovibrionaceae bacterium]